MCQIVLPFEKNVFVMSSLHGVIGIQEPVLLLLWCPGTCPVTICLQNYNYVAQTH